MQSTLSFVRFESVIKSVIVTKGFKTWNLSPVKTHIMKFKSRLEIQLKKLILEDVLRFKVFKYAKILAISGQ